jgi:hypothetical protein
MWRGGGGRCLNHYISHILSIYESERECAVANILSTYLIEGFTALFREQNT